MKHLLFFATLLFLLEACNQTDRSDDSKKVYGSPAATVSSPPSTDTVIKGPLAYAPEVPKIQDGDTVDVKFDAKHKIYKVTPEVNYAAWTFGDSIPGPIIKVRVGRTIRFSMTDRSNESMNNMTMQLNMKPMQHSIDFHAAMVNPQDKYRTIQPGETIQFYWTANYPGVFMYHCATPSVLMHISNGMFGMVIVEPKEGYPTKADKEYAIVQNEYYMKKSGNVYVYDTASAKLKQPSSVTFNGKAGQYVVHPLKAKAGERVRVYVLNVGPNNASSFHVIGTILDKVWLDGNPKNELVGMQSVYLGPASAAIVEFVLPEKGSYPFVDHSFADAEAGATGTFLAE
jgi:nitrite reductase (NO-forming)